MLLHAVAATALIGAYAIRSEAVAAAGAVGACLDGAVAGDWGRCAVSTDADDPEQQRARLRLEQPLEGPTLWETIAARNRRVEEGESRSRETALSSLQDGLGSPRIVDKPEKRRACLSNGNRYICVDREFAFLLEDVSAGISGPLPVLWGGEEIPAGPDQVTEQYKRAMVFAARRFQTSSVGYHVFLSEVFGPELQRLFGIETELTKTPWGPGLKIVSGPPPLEEWLKEIAAEDHELVLDPSNPWVTLDAPGTAPIDRFDGKVIVSSETLLRVAVDPDHPWRGFIAEDTPEAAHERRIREVILFSAYEHYRIENSRSLSEFLTHYRRWLKPAFERAGLKTSWRKLERELDSGVGRYAVQIDAAPAGEYCDDNGISEKYCELGNLMRETGYPLFYDAGLGHDEERDPAGYGEPEGGAVDNENLYAALRGDTQTVRHEFDHEAARERRGDPSYPYQGWEPSNDAALGWYGNVTGGFDMSEIDAWINDLEHGVDLVERFGFSPSDMKLHPVYFAQTRAMAARAQKTSEEIVAVLREAKIEETDGNPYWRSPMGDFRQDRYAGDQRVRSITYDRRLFSNTVFVVARAEDGSRIRSFELRFDDGVDVWDDEELHGRVADYLELQVEQFKRDGGARIDRIWRRAQQLRN